MIPDFLYGTAWKEERTAALTELALRAGFRGIDTANQRRHYFEAGVGQALAAAYRAGIVSRADLFLQTKFTYRAGQDHRLPYDAAADLPTQVAQSLASSLEHLGTDHVDSYVLHGPASGYGWSAADGEVWAAMARQRDAGRVRLLGVSNVSLRHLQQLVASGAERPAFVQNRCFARVGWDAQVRAFCGQWKIIYQAFSLLTANAEALAGRGIARVNLGDRSGARRDLEEALRRRPALPDAWFHRGSMRAEDGDGGARPASYGAEPREPGIDETRIEARTV